MITIGTDPAPETFNDEKAHRAMIARHSKSVADAIKDLYPIVWVGTSTTTANSSITAVSAPGVIAGDLIFVTPRNTVAAEMQSTSPGVAAVSSADTINLVHASQSTVGQFQIMAVRA